MTEQYVMGLDIGGGSGRCLLANVEGGAVFTASSSWSFPRNEGLGFDADLELIWKKLCEASQAAIAKARARREQIAGVAVTSMRFGVVVADASGAPLYAGPNRDARAFGESLQLAAEHGALLNAQTGHWPMPIMAAPRLQWLAANDPDAWRRAAAVYTLNDSITHRMCGVVATDASQAGETLLFQLAERDWAWEWIDRFGFSRELFPQIREAGSVLGALGERSARELGLNAGIPVAQGGGDTQCGLLGVGAVRAGDVAVIAGTTAPVEIVLDRPVADTEARCWQGHHLLRDLWVLESSAGPTGEALDWFGALQHPDSPRPAAALLAEAASSEPGAAGMLSSFGGQVMNARTPVLPVGFLTLSHFMGAEDPQRRRHLARAFVEGLAYAMRANLDQLRAISERDTPRILLGGGMSQSATFAQLLADVCDTPVETNAMSESSALGAATCAGVGAGAFGDLASGADTLRSATKCFEPNTANARRYDELFKGWDELRVANAPAQEVAQGLVGRALAESLGGAAETVAAGPRPRILVTAPMDEAGLDQLRALGEVEYASYRDMGRMLKGDPLVEALQGFEIFITEIDIVDGDAVRRLPELRVVASCRGNAVNVDVESCSIFGIPVLNAPGRNADAVADLALTFMLMLARKFPAASSYLRDTEHEAGEMRALGKAFATLQGRELWRKTVGLVGLGAVGRGVARRVRSFSARVIAFDPFVDAERAALDGVEAVTLPELLEQSDFISLHAPVTDETRGIIGKAELARVKPGAFLINTARAVLIDEDAMAAALRDGPLGGAALDVFIDEPPGSDSPLLALDNVIATPHMGGNTAEVAAHQGAIIAEDLGRLLRDGAPRFALNPEVARELDLSHPRAEPSADALARLAELAEGPGPSSSDLNRTKK